MLRSGKPHTLQNRLDRDIEPVITSYLSSTPYLTTPELWTLISNSSHWKLKRAGKNRVCDSIERVLSQLNLDRDEGSGAEGTSDDSEDGLSEAERLDGGGGGGSNVMNRNLARSMARKAQISGPVNDTADTTTTTQRAQSMVPTPSAQDANPNPNLNGTANSRSTTNNSADTASPHPSKRKADAPHTRDPSSKPAKRQKKASESSSAVLPAPTHISLADIGGMDSIITDFTEHLLLPLRRPRRYMERGVKIPRGILLHGPPGCGKTMLCEALAGELGLPWLPIQGPSIVSGMSGESEKALRQHFEAAVEAAPCLIFIDEIDAITPKRETAQREMERRIVGQLLTCMDELALEKTGGKPVIVLAATNRPDSLDPALRRAGRFDTEINIGVPGEGVRERILRAQTRRTVVGGDVDFKRLAKMTPGFVGADLESLVSRAGAACDARYLDALKNMEMQNGGSTSLQQEADAGQDGLNGIEHDSTLTGAMEVDDQSDPSTHPASPPKKTHTQSLSSPVRHFRHINTILTNNLEPANLHPTDLISMSDFLTALPRVQPSAKREGFATIPDTTFSHIGALQHVRAQLEAAIVSPIRNPSRYERFGINIPAGVLLWGPPGCGKTLLAKAVANESKANFISVKGPELLNKYVGESERAIRQVFFRAASSAPCVVFFDELDALVPRRDDSLSESSARVVNTLLTELDGLNSRKDIYVVGATNRPEMIDPAMLRPGRLGKHLQVWLPGPGERVEILHTLLRKMPVRGEDEGETGRERESLAAFAGEEVCANFSGADLSSLAYEAAQLAVKSEADVLDLQHLREAVKGVKPSVSEEDLRRYKRFEHGFSVDRRR